VQAKGSGVAAEPAKAPQVSDNELLERHLDGEEGPFDVLVRRYERELYNFLVRFTSDAALAEDVFQETFLQLHLSAATFDASRRLKPWLFTIAANKARDALRRHGRRRAAPLDAPVGSGDEAASYADLLAGEMPAPEESLMNIETRQAVQNIVSRMPENLRLVLLLCYFHDLAYEEIAKVLDAPLGTIKSRLHAAVKHFAVKWRAAAGWLDHG